MSRKASAFRLRYRGLLGACRMQVMQLMRQDVAFSAARGWGGCPANVPNLSVFEHLLIRVAQFSLRSNIAVEPLLPHLLNPHYVRASQKNICYADASQMNGLGFPSPSIHPFHSVSSFKGKNHFFSSFKMKCRNSAYYIACFRQVEE